MALSAFDQIKSAFSSLGNSFAPQNNTVMYRDPVHEKITIDEFGNKVHNYNFNPEPSATPAPSMAPQAPTMANNGPAATWPGYQGSTPNLDGNIDFGAVFSMLQNVFNKGKNMGGQVLAAATSQPTPQGSPAATPNFDQAMLAKGYIKGEDGVYRPGNAPAGSPNPSMAPSATPYPQQSNDPNFRFAFETLPRDEYWTNNGPRPNFNPKQPPADIAAIIRKIFPNEATAAAAVAASEDGRYDPRAQNLWNAPGQGIDRGIFAINENTFNGLMSRQADRLKKLGINSFEDMFDPEKNALVASIIKEGAQAYRPETNPQGWGGWYGWQDVGYNMNDGWYSKEDRGQYEIGKKSKKK